MSKKTNRQTWFEVLNFARSISGKDGFGSADLARAAGFKDTMPSEIVKGPNAGKLGQGSTAQQIAAGWLSKFQKWGYVFVAGKVDTGAPRPAFIYNVTPEGMACTVRPGLKARLKMLVKAVDLLEEVKGKAAEAGVWKDLLKVVAEVRPQGEEEEEEEEA